MFILIFLVLIQSAFSNQITETSTLIHLIDEKPTKEVFLYLTNGQIAKISKTKHSLINKIRGLKNTKERVLLKLDHHNNVLSFKKENNLEIIRNENTFNKIISPYHPSIIESNELATTYFLEARKNHKESQCYNRAHIWTYEWRVKNGIFSSKIWLFFSPKFIRKFKFNWWFHVAPLFHVKENNQTHRTVADVKYGKTLLNIKAWTDIFMHNNARCPLINDYNEYADNPESTWCYTMISPMYYYQPIDLEMRDLEGKELTVWNPSDLRNAYLEAFDINLEEKQ
jgi:hypothetical protein